MSAASAEVTRRSPTLAAPAGCCRTITSYEEANDGLGIVELLQSLAAVEEPSEDAVINAMSRIALEGSEPSRPIEVLRVRCVREV
jgi:hypothetical protein